MSEARIKELEALCARLNNNNRTIMYGAMTLQKFQNDTLRRCIAITRGLLGFAPQGEKVFKDMAIVLSDMEKTANKIDDVINSGETDQDMEWLRATAVLVGDFCEKYRK
jgi:hypothetical protein